jgi:hypothetical protein
MKKIALPLIACLALASSAFAGQEVKETKEYKTPVEPCFKDQELQLDIFGTWTEVNHNNPNHNGFGGGLGVNYFFIKYLGIGVDGDARYGAHGDSHHTSSDAVADFTGRLIARYPIEAGSFCLAPYAFVGGGLEFDDVTVGTWHAGGGLEWRATHKLGIFTEGRYTWGGNDVNSTQVRAGVRIVF